MEEKRLTLVFGSSADPFHEGHRALVTQAVKALIDQGVRVDGLIILPVFRHHNLQDDVKQFLPLSYEDRFTICQLAAKAIARDLEPLAVPVSVSRFEQHLALQTNKANFTAETMQALRQQLPPETDLAFLLGIDPFTGEDPSFGHWHKLDELLASTILVVSPRKGYEPNKVFLKALVDRGGQFIFLKQLEIPDISSSRIRERIENREDPFTLAAEGLISPETAAYIRDHDLASKWRELDSSQSDEPVNLKVAPQDALEARIGALLFKQKLNLATAESCTGGLISHRITQVPGASEYFIGGIVSYAYEAKVKLLGVRWETLRKVGAVSSEVVIEMAQGVRQTLHTDLGLSVSCIAGPGGATPNKPVGTSWIALSSPEGNWSWLHYLHGDRVSNMQALSELALGHLLEYLLERSKTG